MPNHAPSRTSYFFDQTYNSLWDLQEILDIQGPGCQLGLNVQYCYFSHTDTLKPIANTNTWIASIRHPSIPLYGKGELVVELA